MIYRIFGFIPRIKKINFPTKLSECNAEQFLYFVDFYNSQKFELENQISAIKNILGINDSVFSKFDSEQISVFLNLFTKLFSNLELERFIIKRLTFGGVDLYSAKKLLQDCSFGEFVLADEFYIRYCKNKDTNYVNYIINAMYRDRNLTAKEHTKNLVELQEMYKFKDITDEEKHAIAFNYGLIRNSIEKFYPELFGAAENENVSAQNTNTGWKQILFSMAPDITKVEEVEMQNVHYALSWLNQKVIESNKQ